MCDEWMQPLRLPISFDEFHKLPRNAAYKYEYFDGAAWLSPRPRFYHGVLDLVGLRTNPLDGVDSVVQLRPVQPADWEEMPRLFSAAFERHQPFGGLDDKARLAAARKSLHFTRTGGDGPWIEQASYQAFHPECQWAVGAILVTLLPQTDPSDWNAFHWRESPPEDCIARRLGRPHLTWILVHPFFAGQGVGTALLNGSAQALLDMGFSELATTFLSGNDSSMLWHWRNGFRLVTHPGSRRGSKMEDRGSIIRQENAT
jgi:GNAT superfamily N-acetyltransferase